MMNISSQTIDKQLIRERFCKSLGSYNAHATAQTIINNKLITLTPNNFEPNKIFEIGCGTGILSALLANKFNSAQFVFNDIVCKAQDYIKSINTNNYHFIMGDIEEILFPENCDLVISGSALQWLTDFPAFVNKTSQALKNKGLLIYNTYGDNNFTEIKTITGSGISYTSTSEIIETLNQKFDVISVESENITLYFDSPLDVLKHMKQTGTNAISREKWTPADFNRFTNEYTKFFYTEKGYSLTYNPVYIVARKK